jgi:hypothetical protein
MDTLVKFAHDLYRNRTDASLRIATAPGCRLPVKFKAKDWIKIPTGSSLLHTEVQRDIGAKGYCFFQLAKGD